MQVPRSRVHMVEVMHAGGGDVIAELETSPVRSTLRTHKEGATAAGGTESCSRTGVGSSLFLD